MRYELIYIVPAKYTDAELPGIQAKVTTMLEAAGAKFRKNEPAGKLKLSYPIKRQRYGQYVLTRFEADRSALPKVNDQLRLSTEVARFTIVAVGPKDEKGPVKLLSHEDARNRAREERAAPPVPRAAEPAPMVQRAPVAAKPALSAEELDKKLDEILNEQVS